MTRPVGLFAATVVLAAAVACAPYRPPVAVEGSRADLDALVGAWHGEYVSDATRQSGGSIAFTLMGSDDVAYGDVLMIRRGSSRPFGLFDPDRPVLGREVVSQSLTILIVRAHDGFLTGEFDPYWDPERECRAVTVFSGRIRGNVITGTYETTYRGPFANQSGTWRVTRPAGR